MTIQEACRYQCLCGGILLAEGELYVCRECGSAYCADCGGRVAEQGGCGFCLSCGVSTCEG